MCRVIGVLWLTVVMTGCVHVRTDPIQVEPIHITVDVYVKVDRELEDIFRDIDRASETLEIPESSTGETEKEEQHR